MVKAKRIVLSGGITYDNVKIYHFGERGGKYIPGMFENYQLFVKNNAISATISSKMISIIQLRKQSIKPYMIPFKRIVITYDQTSFGPAYLIPEDKYNELNIPFIFEYDYKSVEHCAIVADGWLFLTKDELIISMEH